MLETTDEGSKVLIDCSGPSGMARFRYELGTITRKADTRVMVLFRGREKAFRIKDGGLVGGKTYGYPRAEDYNEKKWFAAQSLAKLEGSRSQLNGQLNDLVKRTRNFYNQGCSPLLSQVEVDALTAALKTLGLWIDSKPND